MATLPHHFLQCGHNGLCIIQVTVIAGRCVSLCPTVVPESVIPFRAFVRESAASLTAIVPLFVSGNISIIIKAKEKGALMSEVGKTCHHSFHVFNHIFWFFHETQTEQKKKTPKGQIQFGVTHSFSPNKETASVRTQVAKNKCWPGSYQKLNNDDNITF